MSNLTTVTFFVLNWADGFADFDRSSGTTTGCQMLRILSYIINGKFPFFCASILTIFFFNLRGTYVNACAIIGLK